MIKNYDLTKESGDIVRCQVFEGFEHSGDALMAIHQWYETLDKGAVPSISHIVFRNEEFTDMTCEVFWSDTSHLDPATGEKYCYDTEKE